MKKKLLLVLLFVLPLIVVLSCIPNPAPEVEITTFTQYKFSVLPGDSLGFIDTLGFEVKNGVDAILQGMYIDYYKSYWDGHEQKFTTTHYYALGTFLPASSDSDTIKVYLLNFPVPMKDAVNALYADPNIRSMRGTMHFIITDAYGNGKRIDLTHGIGIWRLNK